MLCSLGNDRTKSCARYGFYFDHMVELGRGGSPLALSPDELARFADVVHGYAAEQGCVAMVLPVDEAVFGGCGAAGKNFFHLSPRGTFEPCPFVPWTAGTGAEASVLEALESAFFQELRARAARWEETGVSDLPCAYRAHASEFGGVCERHGAVRRH